MGSWETLLLWSGSVLPGQNDAASSNSPNLDARIEVALKLLKNHQNVLHDVTQEEPRSQEDFGRVEVENSVYVDQALREISRRLLEPRDPDGARELTQPLNPARIQQVDSWLRTCSFLQYRVCSKPESLSSMRPDISEEARRELKVVLAELGDFTSRAAAARWDAITQLWIYERNRLIKEVEAGTIIVSNQLAARHEAGAKIFSNRGPILKDLTRSSPHTQKELERVNASEVGGHL